VVPILASYVKDWYSFYLTYLILIGVFLVLGVVVWAARRWLRGVKDAAAAPWTFEDLRNLRDQGKLTEAEYQTLRGEMIGMYTKEVHPDASPAAPPPRRPGKEEEKWDWVAEAEPGSDGFEVKKPSPD
jgi:hypothetical protein